MVGLAMLKRQHVLGARDRYGRRKPESGNTGVRGLLRVWLLSFRDGDLFRQYGAVTGYSLALAGILFLQFEEEYSGFSRPASIVREMYEFCTPYRYIGTFITTVRDSNMQEMADPMLLLVAWLQGLELDAE